MSSLVTCVTLDMLFNPSMSTGFICQLQVIVPAIVSIVFLITQKPFPLVNSILNFLWEPPRGVLGEGLTSYPKLQGRAPISVSHPPAAVMQQEPGALRTRKASLPPAVNMGRQVATAILLVPEESPSANGQGQPEDSKNHKQGR